MIRRARTGFMWIIAAGSCFLSSCATDIGLDSGPIPECTATVKVNVSAGTTPTFSWTPDCTIGRLIVESAPEEEYWGTETHGTNIYRSPIVYGVHPPDTEDPHPPNPLTPGDTYRVSLFRWITVGPDSFQLLGFRDFRP